MPTITDFSEISNRIKALPKFEEKRAREILHEYRYIRHQSNCATVSYYVSGFSNILRITTVEFIRRHSFTPRYLLQGGRALKVTRPQSGDLALWYEISNEPFAHSGVVVDDSSSFSMLGSDGPLAVETFEETKINYLDIGLKLQEPIFLRRIK